MAARGGRRAATPETDAAERGAAHHGKTSTPRSRQHPGTTPTHTQTTNTTVEGMSRTNSRQGRHTTTTTTEGSGTTPAMAAALVAALVDPALDAEANYRSKVRGKVLTVDQAPASHALRVERVARRRAAAYRRRNKPLNAEERRVLFSTGNTSNGNSTTTVATPNATTVDEANVVSVGDNVSRRLTYRSVESLKTLWMAYIDDVLGTDARAAAREQNSSATTATTSGSGGRDTVAGVSRATVLPRLLKCDFHGAELTVLRSRNPTVVGMRGILVRETESMLELVCVDDKTRRVAKTQSVFGVDVHGHQIAVYGSQLRMRAAERSARKFKPRPTLDL